MDPTEEEPHAKQLADLRRDIERELTGQERVEALRNIDDLIRGHDELDKERATNQRNVILERGISLLVGIPLGLFGLVQGASFVRHEAPTAADWLLFALFFTAGAVVLLVSAVHAATGRHISSTRIGRRKESADAGR